MSEINKDRRKRRRWGDAPPSATATTTTTVTTTAPAPASEGASDAAAKKAALQQSISARLAALKAKKSEAVAKVSATVRNNANAGASRSTSTVKREADGSGQPASKKAKVYDLDLSVTAPSYQKSISIGGGGGGAPVKTVKKINPYLAHLEHDATRTSSKSEEYNPLQKSDGGGVGDGDDDMILDNRLAAGRMHKARRKKELQFVQPGTFIELAERKRVKAENAAKSGFASGRKVGTFVKSSGMAQIGSSAVGGGGVGGTNVIPGGDNYYGASSASAIVEDVATMARSIPRADVVGESIDGSSKSTGGVVAIPTPMIMEWWDVDSLLPNKLKKEVVAMEGRAVTLRATNRMNLLKSSKNKTGSTSEKNEDKIGAESKEWKQTQTLAQKCATAASISNSKTYKLIQHPAPVKPPNAPLEDAPAPTLHLTKKEMKRQRKLRRAEKQRELQDLQAAGLISAPEPKLTLSNFMRVLGDQAVMDPSKMEAKVMEQIQGRKQKHEKMNADRQLTKEQRSEKRDRKLTEDTSQAVSVALFLVKDMSHRYHRTKVDLNAQQNKITGGVLECEMPKMSLVICEGGAKAIKRYIRLMLVRMKWKGENFMKGDESEDEDEDEDENNEEGQKQKVSYSPMSVNFDAFCCNYCSFFCLCFWLTIYTHIEHQQFNSENSCELVWQGMAPKRMFRSFVFQTCETSEVARKVLEAKGVAHFWDQVLVHASGSGESFNFKLGDGNIESGDGDIVMKE